MNEFEFDELIEVSNYQDFRVSHCMYFIADLSNSKQQPKLDRPIMTLNKSGYTEAFSFARKIAPKVRVVLYGKGSTAQTRQIPQSLADKILAGEV
tara:strand:- start:156 stop:440 length:285 start_codon:yes stop_codon:yes gene_type:complete